MGEARFSIGILGASGFTGAELLRLLDGHPRIDVKVVTADSQAGRQVAEVHPQLAAAYPTRTFDRWDPQAVDGLDLVFCCLPHGASMALMEDLLSRVGAVVDLGADFRLPDVESYERWYHEPHAAAGLLGTFAFGLPELYRDRVVGATRIANPGCYPTCASLALVPLIRAGLIERTGLVVDALSGVSGAGRPPKANTTFCAVDENLEAYGLLDHRHTAEMELTTGGQVLFTPHLVPCNRGMLATCYARPKGDLDTATLMDCLADAYRDDAFIVVSDRSPSTKATLGSNSVHLTARFDQRTATVLVISALDNLMKGASGQALQNANLVLGLGETLGLPRVGVSP